MQIYITGHDQGECDVTLMNDDIVNDLSLKIYPVPTKNILNIEAKKLIVKITLFDAMGNKLVDRKVNKQKVGLDRTDYIPGVYILKITDENNRSLSRKIIEN